MVILKCVIFARKQMAQLQEQMAIQPPAKKSSILRFSYFSYIINLIPIDLRILADFHQSL